MDWMNQIGGLLSQYAGAQPQQATQMPQVENDYDQVAQSAPPQAISQGLAQAFRSPQTPPFGSMAAQLFGQSNPQQQAGLLNTLVTAAGPAVMSQLMNRGAQTGGQGGGALGNLGPLLGMFGGGAQGTPAQMPQQMPQFTPGMAQQIPPQAVEELATHVERHNPNIVEQVSDFYAQQPALVKTLGTAALVSVLAHLAQAHN